jgi:hypothetical protein
LGFKSGGKNGEKIGYLEKNRIIWEKSVFLGKKSGYWEKIELFGKKLDFLGKNPIFRLCNNFFSSVFPLVFRAPTLENRWGCCAVPYWKTALTKNIMRKENETSKMEITNGDDHCLTNFTPVNYTVFKKYYYKASLITVSIQNKELNTSQTTLLVRKTRFFEEYTGI